MILPNHAPLTLRVNGSVHRVEADPGRPLLYVLRENVGLTGTKYGCGEGECGACTVLLDGRAVHSCSVPVSAAMGRDILTIEGLIPGDGAAARTSAGVDPPLHPLQQAFIDEGAFQCGYCTPGMLMAATALLQRNPHPTEAEIVASLQGNLCRCGTYPRIVAAVRSLATRTAEASR